MTDDDSLEGINSPEDCTIMHLNIQSLRCKLHLLEEYIADHEENRIDCLCISETWLREEETSFITLNNYKIAASYCRKLNKNGGVCIFTRNGFLNFEPYTACNYLLSEKNIEFCVMRCQNIFVVSLYRSPTGEMNIFLKNLQELISNLYQSVKINIIIAGDFNINLQKASRESNDLLSIMSMFGLKQTIFEPTRISVNTASCIDNIFVNSTNGKLHVVHVSDTGFSDHFEQTIKVDIGFKKQSEPTFTVQRIFNARNTEHFKNNLNGILTQINFNDPEISIDKKFNIFMDNCKNSFETSFPLKKVKRKKGKNWVTTGIRISSRNKRDLLNIKKTILGTCGAEVLVNYINRYVNIFKKIVSLAKKMSFEKEITQSNNVNKTIWNIVNYETKGFGLKKNSVSKIKNKQNEIISSPTEVANILNDFFLNIVKVDNLVDREKINKQLSVYQTKNVNSIFLYPVNENEISQVGATLKNKYSYGIDGIPPIIFKKVLIALTPVLEILINESFRLGIFPTCLKYSEIVPIFKEGDTLNPSNYRPISLIPVLSKLIEKLFLSRLERFLKSKNILTDKQYGFLKNKSTTLAAQYIIANIIETVDAEKSIYGLSCDFRKAFDSVNFEILLEKLNYYGIRGIALSWLDSYLKGRQQHIKLNSGEKLNFSEWGETKTGIPQGSVLGPTLFLLYINDLPSNVSNYGTVMFADDTFFLIKDINQINPVINQIADWCNTNKIDLNFEKTKCIEFRQSPLSEKPGPLANDIEFVKEIKLLGYKLDERMNWKIHIEYLNQKLRQTCYCLRILKLKQLAIPVLKTVYFSCFQSRLNYSVIFWGMSTDWKLIFTTQKFAIRTLVSIKRQVSARPHFRELKILTIPCLYILECLTYVHKNKEQYNFSNSNTRSQNLLILYPKHNTTLLEKNFKYMAAKIYNKLKDNLKQLNNHNFKKKVKEILIDKAYYTVQEYLEDDDFL